MQDLTLTEETIKSRIFTIRGVQVMLDSDLAELYCAETKVLNQAAKRNIERFPADFMFQLTQKEFQFLRSQIVTLENRKALICIKGASERDSLKSQIVTSKRGGKRKLPYVFTELGVAMLSNILKSETAVEISVQIIRAFIAMRKFISTNAQIFQRLDSVEIKQLEYQTKTDKNFEKVFNAIEDKSIQKTKGIFFEGQVFDSYKFVSDLIRNAKESIILIDNYVDDSVLTLFAKRKENVKVTIYTSSSKQLELDLKKFNSQYEQVEVKFFDKSHDRFMIIDDKEVYHFGASLKDLGKKWFAFSKFDKEALEILGRLK